MGESYVAKLETLGTADPKNPSIHEKAREVLEATLDGKDRELQLMRHQIQDLNEQFQSFRDGMADAVLVLLQSSGVSQEKARALVDLRIRTRERDAFS